MAPIEYIPILQTFYQSQYQIDYPIYRPTDNPWASLTKPLAGSSIGLVCSAGISRRDQPAFSVRGADDLTIREIPVDTPATDLVINYGYYDQTDAEADLNVLLPLARLRELAKEGYVGGLCPTAYTLGIGRWLDPATPEHLLGEVAADLAARCRAQGADAVLLVPG